jgi:hypothetical protein
MIRLALVRDFVEVEVSIEESSLKKQESQMQKELATEVVARILEIISAAYVQSKDGRRDKSWGLMRPALPPLQDLGRSIQTFTVALLADEITDEARSAAKALDAEEHWHTEAFFTGVLDEL